MHEFDDINTDVKSLSGILSSKSIFQRGKEDGKIRNNRDDLVRQITDGINQERVGTKFKPISKRTVALRINRNPILSRDDSEVYNLLRDCLKRKSFKKFFWATSDPNKKKK